MGQLFGARIVVPGTGILLGAPTRRRTAVSPLVIGNPGNGEFLFAGAGGGSPSAPPTRPARCARRRVHGQSSRSALR